MSKNVQNRINANIKRARELHAQFVAGINGRIAHQQAGIDAGIAGCDKVSPEWARALKWATDDSEGTIRQIAALGRAFDFANLCDVLPLTTKGARYVQAKTVEKCFKFVNAVFTQDPTRATDYTVQVLYNALHNGGELHIDDVQASLTRKTSPTDTANLATRGTYSKRTAGSQGSQVRMLADVFKFAEVCKGKRDDVMRIKPELMGELRELFGVPETASAGDEGASE